MWENLSVPMRCFNLGCSVRIQDAPKSLGCFGPISKNAICSKIPWIFGPGGRREDSLRFFCRCLLIVRRNCRGYKLEGGGLLLLGCAVGTLRVWMGFTPGFKLDLGDKDGLMPGREVDTMRYRLILTVKRNGERERANSPDFCLCKHL